MSNDHAVAAGLFRPVDDETKEILATLVAARKPVFAMPSWFVTAESAQVGLMLSEVVRELVGETPGTHRRTFFGNSRFEAFHGAIKLMRHNRAATFSKHRGRVLVLDPADSLRPSFDPLGEGPEAALVPSVIFVRTPEELLEQLPNACGVLLRGVVGFELSKLAGLAAGCRASSVPIAVDYADGDLHVPQAPVLAVLRPDIVVVGERLTGYAVPFGAFIGTTEMFRTWSSPKTAFLHSNTYGGNSLAMRVVKAELLSRWEPDSEVARAVARADDDWDWTLELYGRHVNPGTARMQRKLSGALRVVRADGARLTVQLDSGEQLELVDGLCGAGLGINGHNPDDALTVLDQHDPTKDYVGELGRKLAEETGLAHHFPAVSGATAVETALTLALTAQRDKRRIIVFKHNYGGKTLVSLLATAATKTRLPFGPLYDHVHYVDPFADEAADQLRAQLETGEVALVWIELVHGSSDSFAPIPDHLLDIVARYRHEHGYLVGIDEILTSYYRCNRRFAWHGRLPEVDVVTLSKALSYGCFPTGAALVSDEVERKATEVNPRLVEDLRTRYANQLGAAFALHAISQVDALGLPERVEELSREVRDGLASMKPGGSIGRYFSEGLLGRIEVLPPKGLSRFIPLDGEVMTYATMLWWITKARAFVVYDIFLLPLIATRDEIRQVVHGAQELSGTSTYRILAHAVRFTIRQRLARLRRRHATR